MISDTDRILVHCLGHWQDLTPQEISHHIRLPIDRVCEILEVEVERGTVISSQLTKRGVTMPVFRLERKTRYGIPELQEAGS